MVGLTIGLIVIGVAVAALLVSRGVSGTVSDASGIQQQAAYAMRVIGMQLRQAGSLRLNLSPGVSASAASAAASGFGDDAYLTEVAFETLTPASGGTAFDPASDTITGTASSVTTGYRRYKEPIYTASNQQSLVRNCLGGPADSNNDQKVESVFTFNASTNELRCSGNGATAQPILQNVANFQLRYLVQDNTTIDTTGSRMRAMAATSISNWSQVQAVEVCLVLYGNEPINMTGLSADSTSYIDCDGTTSVNMATLTGSRARRMHLVFRNVFQLRSQGLT
jgi:type IV pilus assembly protein PilW